MRRMTKPRRGGFTLIELLTVVAILALLGALATMAILRVRGSSEVGATEATLSKLKTGLDRKWKAVLDDAAEDISKDRLPISVNGKGTHSLPLFVGNDKDRLRAVWTYCKLKNEFPTTVAEACNPVMVPAINLSSGAVETVQALPPKSVFTAGFKVTGLSGVNGYTDPTDPDYAIKEQVRLLYESAACFQLALSGTATRGETFGGDGSSQQTGDLPYDLKVAGSNASGIQKGPVSMRAFKDAWGNPIAFVRQNYAPELNDVRLGYAKNPIRDPADPQARLLTFASGGWSQQSLDTFWTTLNVTPQVGLNAATLQGDYSQYPRTGAAPNFTPLNWMPTLVSKGANKFFAYEDKPPEHPRTNYGADDDLFSFRLARDSKGN